MSYTRHGMIKSMQHFADNAYGVDATSYAYNKLWKIEAAVEHARKMMRTTKPIARQGLALDERGFPSRAHWMRKFDPSKPHKFFIEVILLAELNGRPLDFMFTEGTLYFIFQ